MVFIEIGGDKHNSSDLCLNRGCCYTIFRLYMSIFVNYSLMTSAELVWKEMDEMDQIDEMMVLEMVLLVEYDGNLYLVRLKPLL